MRSVHVLAALGLAASITVAAFRAGPAAVPQSGVGCRRTDRPPPVVPGDTMMPDHAEDIRRGARFLCTLRRGLPPVRVVLVGDSLWGIARAVEVYARRESARPAQVLEMEALDRPPRGGEFFQGVDLNRDGWMDLKVMIWQGATGNVGFDVFMYDPARRRFARSAVLSGESGVYPVRGRPCVETHWDFGNAGRNYSLAEYCWSRGTWFLVRTEVQEFVGRPGVEPRLYERTVEERRGSGPRVFRVDTLENPIR